MAKIDGVSLKQRKRWAVVFNILEKITIGLAFAAVFISLFLNFGGVQTRYVASNSMVPTFSKNDLILVSTKNKNITVGDIVVYKAAWAHNEDVVHRVVNIEGNYITVKGDNNLGPDPAFTRDKIVGQVFGIYPYVGYLFNHWTILILCLLGITSIYLEDYFTPKGRRLFEKDKKSFWFNKMTEKD